MNRLQTDLFESVESDSPGSGSSPLYMADPEKVRAELLQILAEAQSAAKLPWDARRLRLYKAVFPQMSRWLPEDEAEMLREQFGAELSRLESL